MARILVIDDDAEIRLMLSTMLEHKGYEVMDAINGKEGVRLYREDPVDLIITDIMMPEKDGFDTIKELKRDFPDVMIIAISGGGRVGQEVYLHTARMLGVRHTFAKPVEREELLAAVRELLK